MTTIRQTVSPHLNYFSCLEDDLSVLSRWIEFADRNESVYSIELARLLMTSAAEVDVVAKALCTAIDRNKGAASINVYQEVLLGAVPTLPDALVDMPRFGMSFRPWINWKTPKTPPDWWQGNNKVKHQRHTHFDRANLKNVLNSVAGLLVLLLLLQSKHGLYFPLTPRLFVPRTFVFHEANHIRLVVADDTTLPWA